jgi:hypothetical protein
MTTETTSIRPGFEKAGAKLFRIDPRKATNDAAKFFLEILKNMKVED